MEVSAEQAILVGQRIANVRARSAVCRRLARSADREDLEQEALIALWVALPKFDGNRACFRTFAEHVIANRIASSLRLLKRLSAERPLEDAAGLAEKNVNEQLFQRLDAVNLLRQLSRADRAFACLIAEYPPAEVACRLRISRSTVYDRLKKLRQDCDHAKG